MDHIGPTVPPAALIALAGALIGGAVALLIRAHTTFTAASREFRATFADTLARLRNTREDAFDILNRDFQRHELAVLEFARHLTFRRKRFMAAWKQYTQGDQPRRFLERYSGKGHGVERTAELRALAIRQLESLLAFAAP